MSFVRSVLEGESTYPAIGLFTTDGTTETTLDPADVTAASWSRYVAGTNEVVNSRTNVAISMPLAAIPFALHQTAVDNTRVDTARRREPHQIVIVYTYTYAGASRTGKVVLDYIVLPTSRVIYAPLDEGSRYLRRITSGFQAKDVLTPDDLFDAEEEAAEVVESRLGKRFWSTTQPVPAVIRRIAEKLAVATLRDFIHISQSKEASEYAERLKKEADADLDALVAHKIGVQYLDGTWDTDFPAPGRAAATAVLGGRKPLSFIRELPFHKQKAKDPTEDDLERQGDEDRSSRSGESRY